MTKTYCAKLIEYELQQYDVDKGSDAWIGIFNRCIEAYDVLNSKEVKQLIQDLLEEYPLQTRSV